MCSFVLSTLVIRLRASANWGETQLRASDLLLSDTDCIADSSPIASSTHRFNPRSTFTFCARSESHRSPNYYVTVTRSEAPASFSKTHYGVTKIVRRNINSPDAFLLSCVGDLPCRDHIVAHGPIQNGSHLHSAPRRFVLCYGCMYQQNAQINLRTRYLDTIYSLLSTHAGLLCCGQPRFGVQH